MKFTKMHGTANDYVYIDCFQQPFDRFDLIPALSDRRRGIGGDGVILIMPSDVADVRMRMFNADGSEAEMCGNGARCVSWYAYANGIVKDKNFRLETKAGIKDIEVVEDNLISINMGKPLEVIQNVELQGRTGTFVSVGNPHYIIEVEDVANFDVEGVGAKLEVDPYFPNKANIEFVEIIDNEHAKMRVWERGSGETLSCGTGATATFIALNAQGKLKDEATVEILGGTLSFKKTQNDEIFMTGNAIIVFTGEINI